MPANPLIAEPLYLAGYIERIGTGTTDIVNWCTTAGLKEPVFTQDVDFKSIIYRTSTEQVAMQDTMQVTMQVEQLIKALDGILSRDDLQDKISISNRDYFRKAYINEALKLELIEMTIPEKPNSRNQKYRLTTKGTTLKEFLKQKK